MTCPADDAVAIAPTPFTTVAGWESMLPIPVHPIQSWLDLMEVVEALCPEWPAAFVTGPGDYRL